LLYVLGSRTGWTILKFLCRISVDPETCVLRAAESFYKRGRPTLLVAKFIPGVSTMAAPLAGSMKMPFFQFLGLDFLGASAYALAYGAVGFIFRDFVAKIGSGFRAAGHAVEIVIIMAVIVFYRLSRFVVLEAPRRSRCTTGAGSGVGGETASRRPGKDTARRCTQLRLLQCCRCPHTRLDSN